MEDFDPPGWLALVVRQESAKEGILQPRPDQTSQTQKKEGKSNDDGAGARAGAGAGAGRVVEGKTPEKRLL